MKLLLSLLILGLVHPVFALECADHSYIVHVDPKSSATRAELHQIIRLLTDYSSGLSAGDLKHDTRSYPVLTVNFDARRGNVPAFINSMMLLQSNRGVVVECANQSTISIEQ